MAKKNKFFLDSNVWFSAFYSKTTCYKLINKLLENKKEIVISQLILEETIRNIHKKIPKALPAVKRLFETAPITIVQNPSKGQVQKNLKLADKKDLPIILSAINYQCNFFVTGNIKDFDLQKINKKAEIKILTPRQALSEAST